MAQNRALSARKHRRQPPAMPRDTADADDIDAPVDLVKLSSPQAPCDCPPPHPQLEQLPAADHAVLPLRQLGNRPVKKMSAELSTCGVSNSAPRSHTADAEAAGRAYGAQIVPIRWRLAHEKGPNPPLPPLALIPSSEGGCLLLIPGDPETCQLPRRLCWVKR
jgi:hypothetical protein